MHRKRTSTRRRQVSDDSHQPYQTYRRRSTTTTTAAVTATATSPPQQPPSSSTSPPQSARSPPGQILVKGTSSIGGTTTGSSGNSQHYLVDISDPSDPPAHLFPATTTTTTALSSSSILLSSQPSSIAATTTMTTTTTTSATTRIRNTSNLIGTTRSMQPPPMPPAPDPPALVDELEDDDEDDDDEDEDDDDDDDDQEVDDDDDNDDDDNDFVPDSMKAFLLAADQELEANLKDLLNDNDDNNNRGRRQQQRPSSSLLTAPTAVDSILPPMSTRSIAPTTTIESSMTSHPSSSPKQQPQQVEPLHSSILDQYADDDDLYNDNDQNDDDDHNDDDNVADDDDDHKEYIDHEDSHNDNNDDKEEEDTDDNVDFLSPPTIMIPLLNPTIGLTHTTARNMAMEGSTPAEQDHHHQHQHDTVKLCLLDEMEAVATTTTTTTTRMPATTITPKPISESPRTTTKKTMTTTKMTTIQMTKTGLVVRRPGVSQTTNHQPSLTIHTDTEDPSIGKEEEDDEEEGQPLLQPVANATHTTTPKSAAAAATAGRDDDHDNGLTQPVTPSQKKSIPQDNNRINMESDAPPPTYNSDDNDNKIVNDDNGDEGKPNMVHTPNRNGTGMMMTTSISKATPNTNLQPHDTRLSALLEEHHHPVRSMTRGMGRPSPPRPLEITFESHSMTGGTTNEPSPLSFRLAQRKRTNVVPNRTNNKVGNVVGVNRTKVTAASSSSSSAVVRALTTPNRRIGTTTASRTSPSWSTPDGMDSTSKSPSPWKGRKELTSPDKIPSRLLQETQSSKARLSSVRDPKMTSASSSSAVNVGVGASMEPSTQSKPVLLRQTQSTKARLSSVRDRQMASASVVGTSMEQSIRPKPVGTTFERKPVSPRLLQPTVATQIYAASSPRKASTLYSEAAKESQEAVQKQLQAYIEAEEAKELARQIALEERLDKRRQSQKEKRLKMQAALQRAKEKRLEQEEWNQQNHKMLLLKEAAAKERVLLRQQAQQRLFEENKRKAEERKRLQHRVNIDTPVSRNSSGTSSKVFRPTIPIAPTFLTDSRLASRRKSESIIPLASSDTILTRTLRSPPSTSTSGTMTTTTTTQTRGLTIPISPKFSTKERRLSRPRQSSPKGWEYGLRSSSTVVASSSTSSALSPPSSRSTSRLTIPQTPKFSEIRTRPLPKSTAEREAEEMEYIQAHPFKAQPVRMNATTPSSSKSQVPIPPRPLTTPSPFVLRTEQRSHSARRGGGRGDSTVTTPLVQPFKARPSPDFTKSTPLLTGTRPPVTRRPFTTPEPFQFHTEVRSGHRSRLSIEDKNEIGGGGAVDNPTTFKARPMPDFARHGGIEFQRKLLASPPHRSVREKEEEEATASASSYQFKARPMPDFFKDIPDVISLRDILDKQSEDEVDRPFRARPMPNFDKPSIPVKARQLPSPSPRPEPERIEPFRARRAPKLSIGPTIPVRERNPSRLRSPEAATTTSTSTPTPNGRLQSSKENKRPSTTRENQDLLFKTRLQPRPSPSLIPVHDRLSSSLPSYKKDSPRLQSLEGMSTRQGRNDDETLARVTTTPILSSPKWLPSPPKEEEPASPPPQIPPLPSMKDTGNGNAAIDRLRLRLKERQQQKQSASSSTTIATTTNTRRNNNNKDRFSSTDVRNKLAKVAPRASPEAIDIHQTKESPSPSITKNKNTILSDVPIDTAGGRHSRHSTDNDDDDIHSRFFLEVPSVLSSPRRLDDGMEINTTEYGGVLINDDEDSTTPRAGYGIGPVSFGDPLDRFVAGEAKRKELNRLASAQLDVAMKMAMDVARAAEDELSYIESSSFHGGGADSSFEYDQSSFHD